MKNLLLNALKVDNVDMFWSSPFSTPSAPRCIAIAFATPFVQHLGSRRCSSLGEKQETRRFVCMAAREPHSPTEPTGTPRADQNDAPPSTPVPRPVSNIARRIAAAKDEYRKVSKEVRDLRSSPEGVVIGSDISKYFIGATSIVQDLDIPAAPEYFGIPSSETLNLLETFADNRNIPEHERCGMLSHLQRILACLRSWTFECADEAQELFAEKDQTELKIPSDAIDAIVSLLMLAKFSILPRFPKEEPPSPELLPLGDSIEKTFDPTIITASRTLRDLFEKKEASMSSASCYPFLFVATRGVTLTRKSGLLLSQKVRAIERSYFTWIQGPFTIFLKPLLSIWDSLASLRSQTAERDVYKDEAVDVRSEISSSRVRRVVPAIRLEGLSWVKGLFLPSFTQEPTHERLFMMYREFELDKEAMRRERRAALIEQIKESVRLAVNPIPPKQKTSMSEDQNEKLIHFDGFKTPTGHAKGVAVQLFKDVPWGTIRHFFPSIYVLPATRDLLRIDALTFLGLISALVTYARHSDSAFVFSSLAASGVSYILRVGFGWRQALLAYNGTLARDKACRILAQERSAVDSIAMLAAEESFIEVSCVWMSEATGIDLTPLEIQEEVFQKVSLDSASIERWKEWLIKNKVLPP